MMNMQDVSKNRTKPMKLIIVVIVQRQIRELNLYRHEGAFFVNPEIGTPSKKPKQAVVDLIGRLRESHIVVSG